MKKEHDFLRLLGKHYIKETHKIFEIIGSAHIFGVFFGIVYILVVLILCNLRVNGEKLHEKKYIITLIDGVKKKVSQIVKLITRIQDDLAESPFHVGKKCEVQPLRFVTTTVLIIPHYQFFLITFQEAFQILEVKFTEPC